MKPKEFDDLVKQKFEQNDFAYNPAHWDMLAEQMDGKTKKRNIMMWWWAPLAGMAASVALALGVSTVLKMGVPANEGVGMAHVKNIDQRGNAQPAAASYFAEIAQIEAPTEEDIVIPVTDDRQQPTPSATRTKKSNTNTRKRQPVNNRVAVNSNEEDNDGFRIDIQSATGKTIVLNANTGAMKKSEEEAKNKKLAVTGPIGTFMTEEEETPVKKNHRISVILSGGYNRGAQNTGYMAGATIRKMINDKVYIEGQVAIAGSNNTQSMSYKETEVIRNDNMAMNTGRQMNTGRTTKDLNKMPASPTTREVIKQKDVSYDLYYAQVSPSIGYNVMKRMSIGVGPDFQQALSDNRPAPSTAERGTIQVAPLFDIGFIGKTELSVTKKLRAGVYYRKGVNNIITPTGKFIDRDYLQFQVKYTILNK